MLTGVTAHLEPDSKIAVDCYPHQLALGGTWARLDFGDTYICIHASTSQLRAIANQLNETIKRIEGRERA